MSVNTVSIDRVKEWVRDPEFTSKLPGNLKDAIFRQSGCNCGWNKLISQLLSEAPGIVSDWASKHA